MRQIREIVEFNKRALARQSLSISISSAMRSSTMTTKSIS